MESFHEAQMPAQFVRLFRILIEEEAHSGANFEGPCMEYFLKEKIFDVISALGVKDVRS